MPGTIFWCVKLVLARFFNFPAARGQTRVAIKYGGQRLAQRSHRQLPAPSSLPLRPPSQRSLVYFAPEADRVQSPSEQTAIVFRFRLPYSYSGIFARCTFSRVSFPLPSLLFSWRGALRRTSEFIMRPVPASAPSLSRRDSSLPRLRSRNRGVSLSSSRISRTINSSLLIARFHVARCRACFFPAAPPQRRPPFVFFPRVVFRPFPPPT